MPATHPTSVAAVLGHGTRLLEGDEFEELVGDIRENGLLDPIVKYDGKVLDGRNRWRACGEAKVKPQFTEFEGTEDQARAFVASKETRRHSTKGQRAMGLAVLYPEPEKGGRGKKNSSKIEGFGGAYPSMARSVLQYTPTFVDEALNEAGIRWSDTKRAMTGSTKAPRRNEVVSNR